jgi:hypothetical protein
VQTTLGSPQQAAFPRRIDRSHEFFRMLFEHTNVVRTEHDKSQFAAFSDSVDIRDFDPP